MEDNKTNDSLNMQAVGVPLHYGYPDHKIDITESGYAVIHLNPVPISQERLDRFKEQWKEAMKQPAIFFCEGDEVEFTTID